MAWKSNDVEEGDILDQTVARAKRIFKGKKLPGLGIIGIILLFLWLASGFYIVSPDEQGAVRRFGKMVRITSPGPNYHLPYPIEKVNKPKVTEVKRIEIGFRTVDPGPPAQYQFISAESLMLTGDENIVDAQVIVQYKIKEPANYLFKVRDPKGTLHDASEVALRQVVGQNKIDDALTVGKLQIQEDTRKLLQKIMDGYGSGILVTEVKLQTVRPPKEVEASFKDVVSAKEDRERLINESKGYEEDIIPKARGKNVEITREAEAYKEQRIKTAQGDAERFSAILKEYEKATEVTKKRLYLETMEEILPSIKKFVIDPKAGGSLLQVLPLKEMGGPLLPLEKEEK